MMHKARCCLEEAPNCFFKVIHQISRSHGSKNRRIWPRLGVSGLWLQFVFINACEMMHNAWSSVEEVPYCFPRSSVKFQGHTAKKPCRIWPKLGVSGLLLMFEYTNGYEMMHKAWSRIEEVPYCFSRSYVKLQGHTALKIVDFDPNWSFPDCISSLNSPMATKWCTKLKEA